ncbi:MAG TPA: hypothetical protein VEY09_17530 [Pyrinomonadaceae bacterium]|nr:hypothetical protein [Pyrinomonadaceae bacterium]
MNDLKRPALFGGLIIGILSSIPFVNWVNLCCCAWAVVGGLVAANLYVKQSAVPATPADGAKLGAMSGGVGALIFLVVGVPLGIVAGMAQHMALTSLMGWLVSSVQSIDPQQAEELRRTMEETREQRAGVARSVARGFVTSLLLIVFSMIGAAIGIALFEKRKGGPTPPPPPAGGPGGPGTDFGVQRGGFGGPTAGSYGQGV